MNKKSDSIVEEIFDTFDNDTFLALDKFNIDARSSLFKQFNKELISVKEDIYD